MNAPLRIQIDDATKRKADCWDRAQEGEIDALRAGRIEDALNDAEDRDRALSVRFANMARRHALRRTEYDMQLSNALHLVSRHLNMLAGQYQSDADAFQNGGNAYIMPGDA